MHIRTLLWLARRGENQEVPSSIPAAVAIAGSISWQGQDSSIVGHRGSDGGGYGYAQQVVRREESPEIGGGQGEEGGEGQAAGVAEQPATLQVPAGESDGGGPEREGGGGEGRGAEGEGDGGQGPKEVCQDSLARAGPQSGPEEAAEGVGPGEEDSRRGAREQDAEADRGPSERGESEHPGVGGGVPV